MALFPNIILLSTKATIIGAIGLIYLYILINNWEKFNIGLEIKKDPTDFLRQRTIKSESEIFLINGLCQVVYPYIVEIKR